MEAAHVHSPVIDFVDQKVKKPINILVKKCSRCKITKILEMFRINRRLPSGLSCYCKDCDRKISREWYANNYERNKEKISLMKKSYYQRNKERIKNAWKSWYQDHKDNYNIKKNHNRRVLIQDNGGNLVWQEFIDLCHYFDSKCLSCKKNTKLTVDHIAPLSKMGANFIDNIQPLCLSCNISKGIKTMDYRGDFIT